MKAISASALKDAGGPDDNGCMRKYVATRLAGYSAPPGPAAALGLQLHAYAENYLRDGTPPPQTDVMGRLLTNGLHLLPSPGSVPIVESKFSFTFEGIPFLGYVDFGDVGLRADHKTSSDPKRYGLSASALPQDAQALLYALTDAETAPLTGLTWSGGLELPRAAETDLRWIYYPTRGAARPFAVEARLASDQTVNTFGDLWLPVAREMVAWQNVFAGAKPTAEEINEVENNPSHCDAVGRWCAFFNRCTMHPQIEKVDVDMKSMKERIAAAKAARAAGANALPPEAEPALEETYQEMAGDTTPAPPPDTEPDEPAKGRKKKPRRKAPAPEPAPAPAPAPEPAPAPAPAPEDRQAAALVEAVREVKAAAKAAGFTAEVRLS